MNYYIKETEDFVSGTMPESQRMTAALKPRVDIDCICGEMIGNAIPCPFPKDTKGLFGRFAGFFSNSKEWKRKTASLKRGDTLFLQYPLPGFNLFQNKIFKRLQKRGVRIIALIHDMDWLRTEKKRFRTKFRLKILRNALCYFDTAIVHNEAMARTVEDIPVKTVCLGIFDYLNEETEFGRRGRELPVVIAGNLSEEKAGYSYRLPDCAEWNLYGPYYRADASHIHYFGAFPSAELPFVLEGSFGLVWDGDTVEGCSGSWGNYLRYNNPYKTSLYLACGLPVIIWKEAALAPFILGRDCGIAVGSLSEIGQILSDMSDERYQTLRENAVRVGALLREGDFTKRALKNALSGEIK